MASVIEVEVAAGAVTGEFTVRVVRSEAGAGATATSTLDTTAYHQVRDDLENAVLASAAASRRVFAPGEQRLRDIGRQLFEALFRGAVRDAYRASTTAAGARGERLQVVLQLEAPELAAFPWESMYDAENDEFICRAEPLIRHIATSTVTPLEITPPLRVLVIAASPDGLAYLDVEGERTKLTDALPEPIADGRLHLEWLMRATWSQVQDELLSGTWHILHFIGHGEYDPSSDQGVIALVGDDGATHLVEADRLADLLNECRPTPRLVVLNSCRSGRSGTRDLFSSTAATLVRRGINAVAAMQFSVSDIGAIKFSRGLYSALASGRSVGDAINSGRVGLLSTPGSLEWVTPVLYVRGDTAPLFTIAGPPSPPPAPPIPAPRRPNRTLLTAAGLGGVAVLVAGTLLFTVGGSDEQPPPTTTPPTTGLSTPAASAAVATATPADADAVIAALAAVNVTYTVSRTELVDWLNTPDFTPYPAIATRLLELLGDRRLRRPVPIDYIVYNYELAPGNPQPRKPAEVDRALLEQAVLASYDGPHGADLEAVLEPR